ETIITVQDKNAKAIENVNICWQLPKNRKMRGFAITDKQGKVTLPVALGKELLVVASHVGYKTLIDTIITKKENILQLKQDVFNLEQVVVTGHSKPTPIDSSLYSVKIIEKQKIVSSGASSLADLFFTEPNINISTDPMLGARIEMFGMKGQNVKVMIDGVPLIGRLNGQIDLSQVPVDNIEHIEIIEGPMSVVYGNNALAGTINIITNKKIYHNTEINASAGYESQGRYDAALDIAHKVNKGTFTVSGNYNKFKGVDFDKTNREMDWKPQEQYAINAGYRVALGKWNLAVKGAISDSKVTIKGNMAKSVDNATHTSYYKADDNYYYTDRYTGSATLKGKWNEKNNLSVLVSHSYYDRSSQEVEKNLTTLAEKKGKKISSQTQQNTLMRAVWHHQFQPKKLSLETGLDFELSQMDGERIHEKSQHLDNYAAFVNVRYSPWHNFELQPGIRGAYNTKYNTPLLYSINAKWNIAQNLSWRVSAAKGFRAPTVKELYFRFPHGPGLLMGNDNLKAEKSDSYNMAINYDLKWKSNCLKMTGKLFYNDVYNMISFVQINNDTLQYANIDRYKTRGGSLGATFFLNNTLRVNGSAIATARYNRESEISDTRKFNTTLDLIFGVQVKESYSKIRLNADIKMYGKREFFYFDKDQQGKSIIAQGNQAAYNMLNVSINRLFLKNRLNITIGAKNLLNVKTVNITGRAGGSGHPSTTSGTPIGYGTGYFVKASFKISR
ncbi:MAG: hypothetical protein CSA94_01380, partial [Bacteroidetes bacterium]